MCPDLPWVKMPDRYGPTARPLRVPEWCTECDVLHNAGRIEKEHGPIVARVALGLVVNDRYLTGPYRLFVEVIEDCVVRLTDDL